MNARRKLQSQRPQMNASAAARIEYRAWLKTFLKPRGWKPERK